MNTGFKISASAHCVVLLLALVGWPFSRSSEPAVPSSVSVTLVSPSDLPVPGDAPRSAAPKVAQKVAALPAPAPETSPTPTPAVRPTEPLVAAEPAEPTPAPTPEPAPEPAPPKPPTPRAPPPPPPPPVDRVAPVPVPPTPKKVAVGETPKQAVTAQPSPIKEPVKTEEQKAEAPKAAAPQIVTEATKTAESPSLAPEVSTRPAKRPDRPVPAPEVAEAPPEPAKETPPPKEDVKAAKAAPEAKPDAKSEPKAEPKAAAAPTQKAPAADSVSAALAEALSGEDQSDEPKSAASGPPLTSGEVEGLRLAVGQCWNFTALSTDAAKVTVVVGMTMSADGMPSNVRLVKQSGGSDAAAQQAFETARRAILRCAGNGYSLPAEKFDQWHEVEMTFNPERMRQK